MGKSYLSEFFTMLFPLIFNQHQRIFTKKNNYNHNFPYNVELIFLDFVVLYNDNDLYISRHIVTSVCV